MGVSKLFKKLKLKGRRTKSDDIRGLFIELQIVFFQLFEAVVDRNSICQKTMVVLLGFPGCLQLFDCGQSSP